MKELEETECIKCKTVGNYQDSVNGIICSNCLEPLKG